MNTIDKDRRRRRRTFLYIYLLLALFILLVAASYTWFSLSKTPRVSDMNIYISSQTGLELSAEYNAPDENWDELLDFNSIVGSETQLKPATWSDRQKALLTVNYGTDGRIIGGNSYTVLTDEKNSNGTDDDSYYVKGTFYARSDTPVKVSLGDAVGLDGGTTAVGTYVVGMPLWNKTSLVHDNGGQGAETAVRIGLRITKINTETGEPLNYGDFYIYEPNYDAHIDSSHTGDIATESVDGTALLTDSAHLIRQTSSTWTEANPVLSSVTVKSLGKFNKKTELFTLNPGEIALIDLYIWLEGQDVDCSNIIEDARIIANIQFSTDYSGQSGLENIPE